MLADGRPDTGGGWVPLGRRVVVGLAVGAAVLAVVGPTARLIDNRAQAHGQPREPLVGVRMVDLTREGNVPTLYACVLLLVLATGCALRATTSTAADARRAWIACAVVAVVMAVDEGIGLHEIVLTAIGDAGLGERTDILRYTWVVPGLILALVVGASLLYLARAIPKGIRRQLVFAAVVFLTGAVGFEALSGRLELTRGQDRWFVLAGSIEEILEMLGVLIALHAVVGPVLARRSPDRLDLQVPSSAGA